MTMTSTAILTMIATHPFQIVLGAVVLAHAVRVTFSAWSKRDERRPAIFTIATRGLGDAA